MYLRKVGTDQVYAPTKLLDKRPDMERITDEKAKQIRVRLSRDAKVKRTKYFDDQTVMLNSEVTDEPDNDKIDKPDVPMVTSLGDVKVDEPHYTDDEGDDDNALEALLAKHQ